MQCIILVKVSKYIHNYSIVNVSGGGWGCRGSHQMLVHQNVNVSGGGWGCRGSHQMLLHQNANDLHFTMIYHHMYIEYRMCLASL